MHPNTIGWKSVILVSYYQQILHPKQLLTLLTSKCGNKSHTVKYSRKEKKTEV